MRVRLKILVIALIILIVQMPLETVASEYYSEGYFYYVIEDESISITGYFGNGSEVYVPSSIEGLPVSKISAGSFINTTIKMLYLPETIMEIEENAIGGDISVIYLGGSSSEVIPEITDTPISPEPEKNGAGSNENQNPVSNEVVTVPTGTPSINENKVDISDPMLGEEIEESLDDEKSDSFTGNITPRNNEAGSIVLDDGTKISVDGSGAIVKENLNGSKEIIDDKHKYSLGEKDGETNIIDDKGNKIRIFENGTVKSEKSYTIVFVLIVVVVVACILIGLLILKKRNTKS